MREIGPSKAIEIAPTHYVQEKGPDRWGNLVTEQGGHERRRKGLPNGPVVLRPTISWGDYGKRGEKGRGFGSFFGNSERHRDYIEEKSPSTRIPNSKSTENRGEVEYRVLLRAVPKRKRLRHTRRVIKKEDRMESEEFGGRIGG